jgi:hypothetical protein
MGLTLVNDAATIGTSEYWLASDSTSKTDQTDDCMLQAWIDFGAMAAGDVFEYRVVEKINAGTQRNIIGPLRLVGVQSSPVVLPALIVGDGWEIGVKKISGTDRSIAWSLRKVT